MAIVEHGKIQSGGIVFLEPLRLPEGTEVVVSVEMLTEADPVTSLTNGTTHDGEDFAALACFGMWRDREEMANSVDWVRSQRKQWSHRLSRRD